MKKVIFVLMVGIIGSCTLLDTGIIIDPPNVPSVNICDNVASDADADVMAEKIKALAFKDERMDRAKLVTKGYCFVSSQVVTIMGAFSFPDAELEIAKRLYHQATDKENYDIVIDALVHKSDRDELKAYILEH
ncbi:MAG: DUF4476 domain-containing protein [Crocinitomix sp.]|nr:DUF4476 domain-containing protein [Crocinitomix sp.]